MKIRTGYRGQYLPKGTSLSVYAQAELNAVARRLKERLRETLDYETPAERFPQTIASTGSIRRRVRTIKVTFGCLPEAGLFRGWNGIREPCPAYVFRVAMATL
jgi:hypothetical protein